MYSVKPLGINIKDNERIVKDGFLQESINLQWTDGSFRPIPNRVASDIEVDSGWEEIIFHKVGDDDQVNVLIINTNGHLYWVGKYVDGEYIDLDTHVQISEFTTVTDFDSLSFTILSGMIYFMSSSQQFYLRLYFNEINSNYEVKDMYGWKDLVMFYPNDNTSSFTFDYNGLASDDNYFAVNPTCGVIAIRFALVLKTGEIVLPTPPYFFFLRGFCVGSSKPNEDDVLYNIHTFINLNLKIIDKNNIYEDEISGINVYASPGYYKNTWPEDYEDLSSSGPLIIDEADIRDQIKKQTESTFYLIATIDDSTDDKLFLYAGSFQSTRFDFEDSYDITKIDITTIAAGEEMPIDDNTYHKIYGKITAYNNRLIIHKTKTVINNLGFGRSLGILNENTDYESNMSYKTESEDGILTGGISIVDKSIKYDSDNSCFIARGTLGFPYINATYLSVNGNDGTNNNNTNRDLSLLKLTESDFSNAAFNFDILGIDYPSDAQMSMSTNDNTFSLSRSSYINIKYSVPTEKRSLTNDTEEKSYISNNRIQFSDAGEYAVWPANNSYRVGNGVIKFVGNNSINPANGDYMAPLIIGTSEGIFTANMDTFGSTFIQTITKLEKLPVISERSIEIDNTIICVTDTGLIAISGGKTINLTKDFFPDFGSIKITNPEKTLPNYTLLTKNIFGDNSNGGAEDIDFNYLSTYLSSFLGGDIPSLVYYISDIREYMKDAIFAYESGRNNLWCYNSSFEYSMIYNIVNKTWTLSTYKFTKVIDFNSAIEHETYGNIYSRYLLRNEDNLLDILNSEDQDTAIDVCFLTRAIKGQNGDCYKNINRLIVRCELYRSSSSGYFAVGLWGKQDINRQKVSIPLVAYSDNSVTAWPDDIRQDIPIGNLKGKYKALNLLFVAKILPESSIDLIDIEYKLVNNKNIR